VSEVRPGIAKQPVKEHLVQAAQVAGWLPFDVVQTKLAGLDGVDRCGKEQEIAGTGSQKVRRDFFERLVASLDRFAQAGFAKAALEEGQHVILVFRIVRLESLGGQPPQLAQHARWSDSTGDGYQRSSSAAW
jgi:hypothetical protein